MKLYELIAGQFGEIIGEDLVTTIQASWLRRRIAPETVAINRDELLNLVKNDHLEVAYTRVLLI
jgi:hypothetical protein